MTTRKVGTLGVAQMADMKVICPECEKILCWRGLHGHLRFGHKLQAPEASRVLETIEPFEELSDNERIAESLERIELAMNQRSETDKPKKGFWLGTSGAKGDDN